MLSQELKEKLWKIIGYAQRTLQYDAIDDEHYKTTMWCLIGETDNIQTMEEVKEMMKEE